MSTKKAWQLFILAALIGLFIVACGKTETTKDAAPTPTQQTKQEETAKPEATSEVKQETAVEREKRLIDAAKANKEDTLMLYTTTVEADSKALTDKFTEKYGFKVETWIASSENLMQRYTAEATSGRFDADIIESAPEDFEALISEDLLQVIDSPYLTENIDEKFLPDSRMYFPFRVVAFVQAYNTDKVSESELPKTYADLLDPKWKNRLGIEASDVLWMMGLAKSMGKDGAVQFFKDLVATNGLSVRKGHSLLAELVQSGEVPLALTVYDYKVRSMEKKGAPIKVFSLAPTIVTTNSTAMPKIVKHPNIAQLYLDFVLTEGMKIFNERGYTVTGKNAEHDYLKNLEPVILQEAKIIIAERPEYQLLWDDIVVKQKK